MFMEFLYLAMVLREMSIPISCNFSAKALSLYGFFLSSFSITSFKHSFTYSVLFSVPDEKEKRKVETFPKHTANIFPVLTTEPWKDAPVTFRQLLFAS